VIEQWQLKRDLFLEMKDLALKQKELASEERMDLFTKLSGRRQGIQRKISSMKINGPATGNAKESRIRTLKAECARIIESIQEIDGEIERLLSEKRDALMEEIKAVRRRFLGSSTPVVDRLADVPWIAGSRTSTSLSSSPLLLSRVRHPVVYPAILFVYDD